MSNKGRVDGFATAATDPAVFNPAHSSVGAEGSLPLSAVRNPDCWGCAATGEQVSSAKRLVDAGCSSSIGLHPRRNGVKRRSSRPANSPPPPPSSPPPFLARRASQRETEPIRSRKMSSCHGDGGATPSRIRQKVYKRERAPRVLVARTRHNSSNDDRAAFLVPPPTGPPPCIASPLGEDEGGQGVIKRRRNIATARLRRGDRCDGLYLACGRQQRGRRSDSSSSRSSSGNSNEAGGGCFGGSTSTNSSSSGEHGKTYLIFDDLARMDDAGEDKNSDRGSARKREAHGGDGRNNRRPSFGSQAGNSDNRKRATTSGWTKGKSTAQAAIRHGGESQSENESENDDGDESPGSNAYGRSSAHLSIKRGHKTRGSETTATPSPRDHPPGGSGPVVRETFVGKTLVDVVNEGVMGWLTGSSVAPDEAACRSGGHGGGLHSSGHRPTTTSSSATSLTFRQESTQSSLNNFDSASDGSDGTEIEDSATKCSRRSSGGGGFDKLSASGRALSSRKGESVAATKHHQSIALNERCGGAMDKKHSRSASKADVRQQGRRLLGKGDGKRGGSHRDAVSRDDKAWPRHRPSSTHENEKLADDVVVHEGGSGTVHDDDDDGKCDNAACFRAEHSPTTTIDRGKDGQGTAAGHVSTAETKPRDAHGGWLAAREEKGGGEVRTCENGIASCDDDDASNDSLSDNIVSSKRRYRGNPEGMAVGRGSEDEGRRKDGDDGEASWRDVVKGGQTLARCNSLMLSYERGNNSDMVQCVIVRDRSGMNRLYPHYRFFFEGRGEQPAMVAHKCRKNRTSNYHIFDMKRGGFPTRLSKKNGNYLGKLRTNLKRVEATVFTNDKEVTELGAISFEKPGLVDHLREGSQPRKFSVLLPALDCDGSPVAHKVDPYDAGSDMLSRIKKGRHGNMFLLQSREPTYTNGNYRLNFHGRVTVPSVKNFQLVSPDDTLHTVCQFGKVGEDRFHLDYRAPINAFQAFCIALGQFNF